MARRWLGTESDLVARAVAACPRSATVSFKVSGSAPLAAAGIDQTVAVGNRVVLGGSPIASARRASVPVDVPGCRPRERACPRARRKRAPVQLEPHGRAAQQQVRRPPPEDTSGRGRLADPRFHSRPAWLLYLGLTVSDGLESGSDTVTCSFSSAARSSSSPTPPTTAPTTASLTCVPSRSSSRI